MKTTHNLQPLDWHVSGWTPYFWHFTNTTETGATSQADIPDVLARVPGSVHDALLKAGIIDDWNIALNSRKCEWVENRHWIFSTVLPAEWFEESMEHDLVCDGLDYAGWVYLDGIEIGRFKGSHIPHTFRIPCAGKPAARRLQIIFDCPPRWLGQFGYTSQMTEWKPRFNYTWDWTARLVQIGIWDGIHLVVHDRSTIENFRCYTTLEDGYGKLIAHATIPRTMRAILSLNTIDGAVRSEVVTSEQLVDGVCWQRIMVKSWNVSGQGNQSLYTLCCTLLSADDLVEDTQERRIGFRSVQWLACEGSSREATPWICELNGVPTFLQGVNWTPVRPNFADVTDEQYRTLLTLYRDMGCNLLRVWGGATLEKQVFYDTCDELGLLIWQELPLSSSGIDNWPPEDEESISQLGIITSSYVERRQHHPSLIIWCGGNELQGGIDGSKTGGGRPVTMDHPLIAACGLIIAKMDPLRRFLPTSSSGPTFTADSADFGRQSHWDVHGPWKLWGDEAEWEEYWNQDDALFRSETGAPGASPLDLITWAAGDIAIMPINDQTPLWRRMSWWIESTEFIAERGHEPDSLSEYIQWSQERQARVLMIAAQACKRRFPRCGGFLVWMGHDSFPCPANTAIIDYWGRPKPAALLLKTVFHMPTTASMEGNLPNNTGG